MRASCLGKLAGNRAMFHRRRFLAVILLLVVLIGSSLSVSVPVSPQYIPPEGPSLVVSPSGINFGKVTVGGKKQAALTSQSMTKRK